MFSNSIKVDFYFLRNSLSDYVEKDILPKNLSKEGLLRSIQQLSVFEQKSILLSMQETLFLHFNKDKFYENLLFMLRCSAVTSFITTLASYASSQNFLKSVGSGITAGAASFFAAKTYVGYSHKKEFSRIELRVMEILKHSYFKDIQLPGINLRELPREVYLKTFQDNNRFKISFAMNIGKRFREELREQPHNNYFNPCFDLNVHGRICTLLQNAYKDFSRSIKNGLDSTFAAKCESISLDLTIKGKMYDKDIDLHFKNIEEYFSFVEKQQWPVPDKVLEILKNSYIHNDKLYFRLSTECQAKLAI